MSTMDPAGELASTIDSIESEHGVSVESVEYDGESLDIETSDPRGELADKVRHIVGPNRTVQWSSGGVLYVESDGKFIGTNTLVEIKELGFSFSYHHSSKGLGFVHDEVGDTNYTYAYGADADDQ